MRQRRIGILVLQLPGCPFCPNITTSITVASMASSHLVGQPLSSALQECPHCFWLFALSKKFKESFCIFLNKQMPTRRGCRACSWSYTNLEISLGRNYTLSGPRWRARGALQLWAPLVLLIKPHPPVTDRTHRLQHRRPETVDASA